MLSVMLWESGFCLTRGTSPGLEPIINFCEWVQDRLALLARYRGVLDQRHVFNLLHRSVHATNWNDYACCSDLVARPKVPAEPNSIL
jgi:hypothetical protein